MRIDSAEFVISNTDVKLCPAPDRAEYAFIGRSNVGKSSLINAMTHRKGLAKTSQKPGKTQLINHFSINNEWYLVDLPGYGYARVGKDNRDRLRIIIEDYILERENLTNLFVLLDCRHAPQAIDMEFIEWLGESGIPFSLVFTKADKLSRLQLSSAIKLYTDKLQEQWEQLPPYFITSSETRQGTEELLDYIEQINQELKG